MGLPRHTFRLRLNSSNSPQAEKCLHWPEALFHNIFVSLSFLFTSPNVDLTQVPSFIWVTAARLVNCNERFIGVHENPRILECNTVRLHFVPLNCLLSNLANKECARRYGMGVYCNANSRTLYLLGRRPTSHKLNSSKTSFCCFVLFLVSWALTLQMQIGHVKLCHVAIWATIAPLIWHI